MNISYSYINVDYSKDIRTLDQNLLHPPPKISQQNKNEFGFSRSRTVKCLCFEAVKEN
jgi:hypothetical protein